MDGSPPDSSVHGILRVRVLDTGMGCISHSRGSSSRDQTWVSCIAGRFLYHLSHQGSPPVDHSARSGCYSLQPGAPGSNICPSTFARTSCNVTGAMSISSYCPRPHEAQYRGPNPEHSPPGQSECLWADGPGAGGLANRQHEPSSPSRRQVRS